MYPRTVGSVIVSWDFSHDYDKHVLLVGHKAPGKDVEVINAFQGKEAHDIYDKLTTVKKSDVKSNV